MLLCGNELSKTYCSINDQLLHFGFTDQNRKQCTTPLASSLAK